jgi:hypothetical protein
LLVSSWRHAVCAFHGALSAGNAPCFFASGIPSLRDGVCAATSGRMSRAAGLQPDVSTAV